MARAYRTPACEVWREQSVRSARAVQAPPGGGTGPWLVGIAVGTLVVFGSVLVLAFMLSAVCVITGLTALGTQLNDQYGDMAEPLEDSP